MRQHTEQFAQREIRRELPVIAFEMWVAVWSNRGRGHIFIGAPTLDALAERWEQITNSDFDRSLAQRVCQVAWRGADSGTEPLQPAVEGKP